MADFAPFLPVRPPLSYFEVCFLSHCPVSLKKFGAPIKSQPPGWPHKERGTFEFIDSAENVDTSGQLVRFIILLLSYSLRGPMKSPWLASRREPFIGGSIFPFSAGRPNTIGR
jgi:hypothetical protein